MRNIDKKYHYLYKTTNLLNNKYYYGIHSTNKLDDGYLGSGKVLRHSIRKYGKENFKKEIISFYNSREELANAEKEIITESVLKDKYNMNCMYGGEGWNTIGMVTVKNENGLCFSVFKDDPRYLNGELIHTSTGFITVKDKNGSTFQVSKTDERYLNGELVGITKGMILVKDKDKNLFYISKDDERYLNGELIHIWTGKQHSEETKKQMSESSKGMCTGEKNGSFGTCWVHKYSDKINKKIKKIELDNYLNDDWIKGRRDFNKMIAVNIYDLNNNYIESTTDIIEYCRINNYNYETVYKVLKGKYKYNYVYNKFFKLK